VKSSNTIKTQILRLTNEKQSLMNFADQMNENMKRINTDLAKLHEELAAYRSEHDFKASESTTSWPDLAKDKFISGLIAMLDDSNQFEEHVYLLLADKELTEIVKDMSDYIRRVEEFIVTRLRREIYALKS
jgi:hypothetical protein